MAFRTFIDGSGNEWQAYDVVPPADERRRTDRRGDQASVDEERRDFSDDRRLTVGRVPRVTATHQGGWLVFERGAERRRLAPIPADWPRCSDEVLEGYRLSARAVPQPRFGRLTGVAEGKS